jgi:hypothetical protein
MRKESRLKPAKELNSHPGASPGPSDARRVSGTLLRYIDGVYSKYSRPLADIFASVPTRNHDPSGATWSIVGDVSFACTIRTNAPTPR